MSAWISHVKSYAKKNKVSYKEAMSKAKSTYKGTAKSSKQTKKDKKDESKGMKGQTKGSTSKSNKNFESNVPAKKRGRPKKAKMETAELDGKKVKFKSGGLHAALKTPEGYTFKRSVLNKIKKVAVGEDFDFLGKKRKMTGKLKKQVTLGLNLMKK